MWLLTKLCILAGVLTFVASTSFGGDSSTFALDQLSLQDFLSVISGVVKIGNVTIKFPDDLPKLFGGGEFSSRRGFGDEDGDKALKIKIKSGFDEGWGSGWGWTSGHHGPGKGLLSLANFFRVGCILFDLREIKESTKHGMY